MTLQAMLEDYKSYLNDDLDRMSNAERQFYNGAGLDPPARLLRAVGVQGRG